MPTILSHAAVPLAVGFGLGRGAVPPRLLLAGVVGSIVPDLDVLAFHLHVDYSAVMGHRGFSHSIGFALAMGLVAMLLAGTLRCRPLTAFVFVAFSTASHGILDMFTNGGRGVALWWPLSAERLFAPWQVIEASPLSLRRVFGGRGLDVLQSELLWVWLPAAVLFLALFVGRHVQAGREARRSDARQKER